MIEVLLFASYREQVGQKTLKLELPAGATVRDAAERLEAEHPTLKLKGALAARNEVYAAPDEVLGADDTLAFFPPVAGGSGAEELDEERDTEADAETDHFFVTESPLDIAACTARVSRPEYGAVSSFLGTVRSPNYGQAVSFIEYQGYETMIVTQMQRAAAELRAQFELGRIVFGHRLGKLLPGEASIVIVVSSAHRKEALLATHAAIDRLKELLPVWKLEGTSEGQHWVAGSAAASEPL